ncbi:MAG: GNAT family N-acetyltransferase [Butyrivibrio sp.]|nr:GNAT family N-acetyltransferase [Butyrivibrio sp.]
MRIEEEKITLKDGRILSLRSAEEKDAQTMLDYLIKTAEETHFLVRYPEEISPDLEKEKEIINNTLEAEDSVWFTVFDGDKAVGNCAIACHRNQIKLKHRCDFAIAIEQAYCGCGLGTILMTKAIDKARELGFEQLELGVFADNEKGIALYKKMGFKEMGRNLKAFKQKDGTYIDEINMILFLFEISPKFFSK